MIIDLNNRTEEFPKEPMTVSEILSFKNFTFPQIIVKLNGKLIKKPTYTMTTVKSGDILNIIHLISGG